MSRQRLRGVVLLALGVLALAAVAWPGWLAWLVALLLVPAWAVLNIYAVSRWLSWLMDQEPELGGSWPPHLPMAVGLGTLFPWTAAAIVAVPLWLGLVAHLVGAP